MGNWFSSEELGDIKPEIIHFANKEDSPVTIVEYPAGYMDELKEKLLNNDSVRHKNRSKSKD